MKLAAIYNVFDGHELLEKSIMSIRDHVNKVIVIWQDVSNYNDYDASIEGVVSDLNRRGIVDHQARFVPVAHHAPFQSETLKRKWGIKIARELRCSHFLSMDVDEFYIPDQFKAAKKFMKNGDWGGSACRIRVYYKSPELCFKNLDRTWVPFIHKIDCKHTGHYPVYADNTRKVTYQGGFVEFPPEMIIMHHYSWVRKDIEKKVKNSTAYPNLERHGKKLFSEWEHAKEGSHIKCVFNDTLVRAENIFGIEI